ncbi:MAG: hypothetical protein HQL07_04610 [Nitrospirae bacterium]|nr:hypothetical protein [Magnetococcales bacterium]HAT50771.1 hypothetical protein [Alphaproteobacteria bacterium]
MVIEPEERIWAKVREFGLLKTWRFQDLADDITVHREMVRSYVSRLIRGGFLTKTGRRYQLIRDNGVESPRLRKSGEPVPTSNREKMWLAMEGMRDFSALDLAFVTAVPVNDAKSYISHLAHVGILVLVSASRPGKAARRHTLRKWTGPKPMRILRDRSVFDPNTGKRYLVPGPNVKLVRRTMVPLPDWILKLAERCDSEGQGRVAAQIGYSKSVISQVLSGKYTGRIDWVERAVVKHLISIE